LESEVLHPTILSINGVPVWIRPLAHGDIAVWHPFNLVTRRVVKAACRGRGRWSGQYNNWIVFRQFANLVLSELSAGADHV